MMNIGQTGAVRPETPENIGLAVRPGNQLWFDRPGLTNTNLF
jgi:hypothetical protein